MNYIVFVTSQSDKEPVCMTDEQRDLIFVLKAR